MTNKNTSYYHTIFALMKKEMCWANLCFYLQEDNFNKLQSHIILPVYFTLVGDN